jgi:hypothetical protein
MRAIVLATANATRIRAETSKAWVPAKPAAVSLMQVTATPAAVLENSRRHGREPLTPVLLVMSLSDGSDTLDGHQTRAQAGFLPVRRPEGLRHHLVVKPPLSHELPEGSEQTSRRSLGLTQLTSGSFKLLLQGCRRINEARSTVSPH